MAAPATAPAAAAAATTAAPSSSSSWASALLSKDARYALAGGIAGATAKTCTAPLARLTILYQVEGATARAGGGGVGGAATATATTAATTTTTKLPRSVPAALASLVRREGVLALWRGNGVTILHRLPYSSINFWAYERSFAALDAAFPEARTSGGGGSGGVASSGNSSSARAFGKRLAAGAVAGGVACAAAYPLDLVRTRLAAQVGGGTGGGGRTATAAAGTTTAAAAPPQPQPQQQLYYRGVWGTLSTIARDEGLFGLYRGLGATLVQVVPTLGLNFGLYETSKAMVRQRRQKERERRAGGGGGESGKADESLPPAATLACGCISGFVTATATFPLDVVRRRMQVAGQQQQRIGEGAASSSSSLSPPAATARPSYAQVAREVVRQGGGFGGFYRGIGAEYCKVVPGVAIAFFVYESAKNALGVGVGAGGGGGGAAGGGGQGGGGGERRRR